MNKTINLLAGDEVVFTATGASTLRYELTGTVNPLVRNAISFRDEEIRRLRTRVIGLERDLAELQSEASVIVEIDEHIERLTR